MADSDILPLQQLTVDEVFAHLGTSAGGLSLEETRPRLGRHGPNVLEAPNHYSLIRGVLYQFTHFLAMLLWIAAGLAFTAEFMKPGEGMLTLDLAILGVVVINTVAAFFQEYTAEGAVHVLHRPSLPEHGCCEATNRMTCRGTKSCGVTGEGQAHRGCVLRGERASSRFKAPQGNR